jgi:Fur family iron response transcriptional regulator
MPLPSATGLFSGAEHAYMAVMTENRPFTDAIEMLRAANLRPTRQRLALVKLLFGEAGTMNRHVTAEQLHHEAGQAKVKVSLATVYNTLNQFTQAGLMREVVVEPGRSYFDTNTADHHHFFMVDAGELHDISADALTVDGLPEAPAGTRIDRVDVIVRVRGEK